MSENFATYASQTYSIFLNESERGALQEQYQGKIFEALRQRHTADLAQIYSGKLADSCFSWWAVNLPQCEIAGEYQASLEALALAHHLCGDERAAGRAREILLQQAAIATLTEPDYGDTLGHDLSSSHHCRALAAGLDIVAQCCTPSEIAALAANYASKVRQPYIKASFGGNPYLYGLRNTNWLAHISGSMLLVELALARYGLADQCATALAKANVLRYLDAIRPAGSLPEIGDYYHYGVEFSLVALHAWSQVYGSDLMVEYRQPGLRNTLAWPLAFTDKEGTFWADFGDTHCGFHFGAKVVGYLMARHFDNPAAQWLGDRSLTREPLAALLRPPALQPTFQPVRWQHFPCEEMVAINLGARHLALQGGACRSAVHDIPHRHYDSGSIIYRLGSVNVIADSGFQRYTDDYWNDFDDPNHVRSASYLHNLVLADNRGHRKEDSANGRVLLLEESPDGVVRLIWQYTGAHPGLKSWERQILLGEAGPLVVVDVVVPQAATAQLSLLWHLHATAEIDADGNWRTELAHGRIMASAPFALASKQDHPAPYLRADAASTAQTPLIFVTTVAAQGESDPVAVDWQSGNIVLPQATWNFKRGRLA